MKQTFFLILFATLFAACNNDCGCRDNDYTVNGNPCVCIKFKGQIGNDFDSALDSLKRQYEPLFQTLATEGHYSGKGYYIEKEKINVDFADDDRAFFCLIFVDSVSVYINHLATMDVIDEKGNYYYYHIGLKD